MAQDIQQEFSRLSHRGYLKDLESKGKPVPQSLIEERAKAEIDVYLARYYEDAVELARLITEWSKSLGDANGHRFVVCSGVEKFPGHIYCDPDSKSEIVVPIIKDGEGHCVRLTPHQVYPQGENRNPLFDHPSQLGLA